MKFNGQGFEPRGKLKWYRQFMALERYITDIEVCLDAANLRLAEQDAELKRLRESAPCGCPLAREGGRDGK